MPDLKFEPLGKHDRAAFACENKILENYIKKASQDVRRNAAATYVATRDGKTILGYYTLSQYSIQLDEIPEGIAEKKLAKYKTVSATLLGRLARHTSQKGTGLGELPLIDALHRAFMMNEQIASAAVVVDAKDDHAVAFYKKHGFIELPKTEKRLFIPMESVKQLFSGDKQQK